MRVNLDRKPFNKYKNILAIAYSTIGVRILAIGELKKCIEINPKNLSIRLMISDLYIEEGGLGTALEHLQTILTLYPGNIAVNARLDKILFEE